uniref:Lipid scramblase CLPTM1L n=1 Tax=Romanomermis culicivorax TaxID=13658 RepID=A0A915L4Z7_ROMCU
MGLKINLWSILSCVFMAYIANSVYHLYKIYFPSRCNTNEKIQNSGSRHKCLDAALDPQQEKVLLTIYLSTTGRSSTIDFQNAVLRKDKLDLNSDFEEHIEINIPKRTSNNGTLWLHAFLSPISKRSLMDDPRNEDWYVERKSMITNYMVPKPETINLMKKEDKNEQGDLKTAEKPTSHLRSIVTLVGVGETFSFFWNNVPEMKRVPGSGSALSELFRIRKKHYQLPGSGRTHLNYLDPDNSKYSLDITDTN